MKLPFKLIFIILILSPNLFAEEVEQKGLANNTLSSAQITTQAVQTGEHSKNYEVTGENMVALLERMLDFSNPQTAIVFDRWTGQLFIKQTPQTHQQIEKILEQVRISANQQVEIEARIMTVSGVDFSQIGLDFLGVDALSRSAHGKRLIGTDDSATDESFDSFIDFQNLTDAGGSATGGQLGLAVFKNGKFNISAVIDFLEKNTQANTLSAPRLTVFNNQRAHIKISQVDYYVKSLTIQSDATADTVATEVNIDTAKSGTVLDVTPTINKDGTITLELHPQFVTVDLTDTQTINVANVGIIPAANQPFVTLPVYKNQTVDTTTTIEDGGVIVLGGLIDERESATHQRIPGVSDIPVVGKIFQNKSSQKTKTHLLIFIRAKTIKPQKLEK